MRLSAALSDLDARARPGTVTLGDALDQTAHAGFGVLLVILALVSIPLPGISMPFGLAIAVLGAQLLAGRSHPWLPAFLRRRVLPPRTRGWLSATVARFASRLERLIKPRLRFAVRGPLIGLGLVLQGVGLALPLPIPGSNWIFIVPVLVYAIGLMEDDGLWILVAQIATVTQIVIGVVFAGVVARLFS